MSLLQKRESFDARTGTVRAANESDQDPPFSVAGGWPTLSLLFAASGCAALIYEIVWFQILQLVIGATAVSLAVLLSSFMGGMCVGSLWLPRYFGRSMHPLRTWASLELGIGVLGICVYLGLPWLGHLYAGWGAGAGAGFFLRAALCSACLLPPTVLMGATLPTIARLAGGDRKGMARLGCVYCANTLGAVLGAFLTGFVLLRLFNAFTAICVAGTINLLIALIASALKSPSEDQQQSRPYDGNDLNRLHDAQAVSGVVAISGFCALAAEVIWTRVLSLMLGSTTYTFSIILGVFLLGLALGNSIGTVVGRLGSNPRLALAICQLGLAAAVTWAACMLALSLPYWPLNPTVTRSEWLNFQVDLLRCLWAVLPAACLWGATFPLALAAAAGPGQDPASLVGGLYAANTLGGIFGAVAASVFLIPQFGTQRSQQWLILLSAVAGTLALTGSTASRTESPGPGAKRALVRKWGWGSIAITMSIGLLCLVPPTPWGLIAYGRYLPMKTELGRLLYSAEGMNASVAVTETATGVRNFHVSGKIEASTDQQDMRLQRMLAHIPALFHSDPHSVLVVGCGAGVTAGSFLTHPRIERITLCEIEPLIPKVVASYFGAENYDVVRDSHVRLVYDDARHYIFTTRDKFDIITSDPIHPWVKGAAALYTREYFELCKRHLNPGGMVTQWVPLYESDIATVKTELATFFEVFPEGTIWSNENLGEGYDLVLLGQVDPLEVDVATMQQRLIREDHQAVLQSLRDVGVKSAFALAATYQGRAHDLRSWLKNAQINHDRDLRLQYLAGLGLNAQQSDFIYEALSSYRRFPEDIFVGSNLWNEALRHTLAQPPNIPKPGAEGKSQLKSETRKPK